MASDFWSLRLRNAFCSLVIHVYLGVLVFSCLFPQVSSGSGGSDFAAEDAGFELHPDNQIILQPNPGLAHPPTADQNDLDFVCIIAFRVSVTFWLMDLLATYTRLPIWIAGET